MPAAETAGRKSCQYRRRMNAILVILGFIFGALAVLPYSSPDGHLFDLLSHFSLQYLILSAALFVFGTFRAWRNQANRWPAVVFAAVTIFHGANLVRFMPLAEIGARSQSTGSRLVILQANVQRENRQFGKFIEMINAREPDIVVVQEIDDGWAEALTVLAADYPFSLIVARPDRFGIGLYSRVPITAKRILRSGRYEVPMLVVDLDRNGETIRLAAVHLMPPVSRWLFDTRNQQLRQLAALIGERGGVPTIVAGDLNVTPFAPAFRAFLRQSGLMDSRAGNGLRPGWPTSFPPLMRIPIDHILHDDNFVASSLENGPPFGSDHLPLIAELELRRR